MGCARGDVLLVWTQGRHLCELASKEVQQERLHEAPNGQDVVSSVWERHDELLVGLHVGSKCLIMNTSDPSHYEE